MEFLSKKDFLNLVDAYCKEVGRKHIENLYFLFRAELAHIEL